MLSMPEVLVTMFFDAKGMTIASTTGKRSTPTATKPHVKAAL